MICNACCGLGYISEHVRCDLCEGTGEIDAKFKIYKKNNLFWFKIIIKNVIVATSLKGYDTIEECKSVIEIIKQQVKDAYEYTD